jgi:subtilase family serine protease
LRGPQHHGEVETLMSFRRGLPSAVTAIAMTLAFALPAVAAPSQRATLAGSVPPWANSASFKGAATSTDSIGFRVYMGWNNPAAAEALAMSVSDPSSSTYRHFLTPQEFRRQFAPSQQQVGSVQSWLKSQGFHLDYTPQNNHYVAAEGTVAQAASAFGTTFGLYSASGLTLRSPSSDISVPSSLAGVVSGVIGLDESAALVHTNIASEPDAPPSGAFVSAQPCSNFWGDKTTSDLPSGVNISDAPGAPGDSGYALPLPLAPCGYTPSQIRGAYVGGTSLDGSGQTVAIIDAYASPTIQADLNSWSFNRGMASTKLTQVIAPGTLNRPENKKQSPQGWYGEETLDVEAVHGMAPGASIVFVGAPNNYQDLDAALNHVVDQHLASIVTNSYGFPTELLPPGFIKPYEDTIVQGAAEGIGIYFSSGDNSDESLVVGYRTADWPASSPFVTAVGGTSLGVGQDNSRVLETGWGTFSAKLDSVHGTWSTPSWLYGAGGGVSQIFAEPSYQQSVDLTGVFTAQGRSGRAVPDISAFGDPNTGYLIGQTQTFPDGSVKYSEYRIGGTSLSSPIMAGIMALADQSSGTPHGFANPLFYQNAGTAAFYDVQHVHAAIVRANYVNSIDNSAGTVYRLRTFDNGLSLQTTAGYDDITGLGTPGSMFLSLIGA